MLQKYKIGGNIDAWRCSLNIEKGGVIVAASGAGKAQHLTY